MATAELDQYVTAYTPALEVLHKAAVGKTDIDDNAVQEAMESAKAAIEKATAAFPTYRDQGWLGTRADGYSKQFDAAGAQFDKDSKTVSSRLEQQRNVASARAQLCNTSKSLDDLKNAEVFQRRVDAESGTVDLAAKRRRATAKVFLEDQRKKLLADLRTMNATFDAKRDCTAGP